MADNSWWLESSELDDEQIDVIGLSADGSYLVVGPPGCGKTNLLLLRASYLVDAQRPNVVVLMFTRSLREFVVRGTAHYSLSADKIRTIMRWQQDLLREHVGVLPKKTGSFDDFRREHAVQLKAVFDRKPALAKHLDCILVDEVQDCLPEEIELFFRAAKQVFFVGDDRQQIYSKNDVLDSIAGRVTKKELTKHYRNGEAICKVADVIGKTFGTLPLIDSCNYDETKAKSSVVFEKCVDDADLSTRLITRLTQQLKAYPGELIGVACPKNEDVTRVREALSASPQLQSFLLADGEFSSPLSPERRVAVCSMHDAKGLEFRAMHLAYAERLNKMGQTQKRLAYTGVTRAKTSLAVYHVDSLPGYIEQARDVIAAPKPPPKVNNLFPGKTK